MHGPSLATLLVVATLGLATSSSTAGTPDAIAEARRKLALDDGIAAVAILEEALPGSGTGKEAVLSLLRSAYEAAASQAQKAGRVRDSETYRENLNILNRKSRPIATAPDAPRRNDAESAPGASARAEAPPSLPDPPARPTPLPDGPPSPERTGAAPLVVVGPPAGPPSDLQAPTPSNLLQSPVSSSPDLSMADAAFADKDYRGAGRIYAALERAGQLPPERRDHWLYCRAFEVVNRINARPRSDAEWTSIKAEIDQIRVLTLNPNNYLAEYLRDLAVERQSGRQKAKPSTTLVVRGSAPEEPPPATRAARPDSGPSPSGAVRPSASLASNNTSTAAKVGPTVGRWQTLDSANFRIYHLDPALAAKVARSAESARLEQTRRWTAQPPRGSWSPLCEIYLYPTARQYSQMTGQPEDSPGFSTMGMNAGRIISRRINLRADHSTLVTAVLPHEVTHVILADFFTEQQIPRWADEGLSVLSEPAEEQKRRAADLNGPLAANRLFPVEALMMSQELPEDRYWGLFYAQSVSLTRFLVERGTPAQMIQFLQGSQREGYESMLRRVYKIDGYADLQRRWLTYARAQADSSAATASGTSPDLRVR